MAASVGQRAKILFVMANFAGGGAERVALTLLDLLGRSDFEPQLAVFDDGGPLRELLPEDVPLHVINRPRLSRALPNLLSLIRRERPAVVFASQGYINIALLASRFLMPAGTRLALRESNTPSQSLPARRHPQLMRWAYGRYYPRSDLLICQHRQTEQEMEQTFGVDRHCILALPNPVPEAQLRARAANPQRPAGPGQHFVAAGRLHRQKGFDRLIDLFAGLPETARLTIYGEGSDREPLLQQIRSLQVENRVLLAGYSDNLPAALAGADACVVSSRWEGLPNVALEALAVGTPVIATPEAGGINELAEAAAPGTVAVAPWGEAFAAELAAREVRQVMGPAPSLLPDRYRLENVAAKFNGALLALAGSGTLGKVPEPVT